MILAVGYEELNAMSSWKLAIQSTVSTMGTIAIAAAAMTNIMENLNGIAAIGIGIWPDDGRRAVHGSRPEGGGGLLY